MNPFNKPKSPENERTPEVVNQDVNHANTEKPNHITSRRKMLGLLFLGGLGALMPNMVSAQSGWREAPSFDEEPTWTPKQLKILSPSAELMDPVEVERMQKAQEAIFRAYLSPSLTMYMKDNPNVQKIVDEVMEATMRNPFELKYAGGDNGTITIRKKINSQISAEELQDNIEIKMDGSGNVVMINGIEIPVFSQNEYDRLAKDFDIPQFENALKAQKDIFIRKAKLLGKTKNDQTVRLVNKSALQSLPGTMKKLFESRNIDLPRRLKKCIETRNKAYGAGKFDNTENAEYKKFERALSEHAENFDDMASDYPAKLKIWLELDPKRYPGIYIFSGKVAKTTETDTKATPAIDMTKIDEQSARQAVSAAKSKKKPKIAEVANTAETAKTDVKAAPVELVPFTIAITREGYLVDMESKTMYRTVIDAKGNPVNQTKTKFIPKGLKTDKYDNRVKNLYNEKLHQTKLSTD